MNNRTFNMVSNAARIGCEFGPKVSPSFIDQIVLAAEAMAKIESRKGFIWDEQCEDWESVCAMIVDRMRQTYGGKPNWEGFIRNLLLKEAGR